jgi:hypothetical protein
MLVTHSYAYRFRLVDPTLTKGAGAPFTYRRSLSGRAGHSLPEASARSNVERTETTSGMFAGAGDHLPLDVAHALRTGREGVPL